MIIANVVRTGMISFALLQLIYLGTKCPFNYELRIIIGYAQTQKAPAFRQELSAVDVGCERERYGLCNRGSVTLYKLLSENIPNLNCLGGNRCDRRFVGF